MDYKHTIQEEKSTKNATSFCSYTLKKNKKVLEQSRHKLMKKGVWSNEVGPEMLIMPVVSTQFSS